MVNSADSYEIFDAEQFEVAMKNLEPSANDVYEVLSKHFLRSPLPRDLHRKTRTLIEKSIECDDDNLRAAIIEAIAKLQKERCTAGVNNKGNRQFSITFSKLFNEKVTFVNFPIEQIRDLPHFQKTLRFYKELADNKLLKVDVFFMLGNRLAHRMNYSEVSLYLHEIVKVFDDLNVMKEKKLDSKQLSRLGRLVCNFVGPLQNNSVKFENSGEMLEYGNKRLEDYGHEHSKYCSMLSRPISSLSESEIEKIVDAVVLTEADLVTAVKEVVPACDKWNEDVEYKFRDYRSFLLLTLNHVTKSGQKWIENIGLGEFINRMSKKFVAEFGRHKITLAHVTPFWVSRTFSLRHPLEYSNVDEVMEHFKIFEHFFAKSMIKRFSILTECNKITRSNKRYVLYFWYRLLKTITDDAESSSICRESELARRSLRTTHTHLKKEIAKEDHTYEKIDEIESFLNSLADQELPWKKIPKQEKESSKGEQNKESKNEAVKVSHSPKKSMEKILREIKTLKFRHSENIDAKVAIIAEWINLESLERHVPNVVSRLLSKFSIEIRRGSAPDVIAFYMKLEKSIDEPHKTEFTSQVQKAIMDTLHVNHKAPHNNRGSDEFMVNLPLFVGGLFAHEMVTADFVISYIEELAKVKRRSAIIGLKKMLMEHGALVGSKVDNARLDEVFSMMQKDSENSELTNGVKFASEELMALKNNDWKLMSQKQSVDQLKTLLSEMKLATEDKDSGDATVSKQKILNLLNTCPDSYCRAFYHTFLETLESKAQPTNSATSL